jgi:hypothetical protein
MQSSAKSNIAKVMFTPIVGAVCYQAWCLLKPGLLTRDEQKTCSDFIDRIDEDVGEICDVSGSVPSQVRPGGFTAAIVRLAKNEYGHLDPNRANHEMVRKFLLKKMLERGVTSGDISRHLPLATNLVFVANKSEQFAAKFLISKAAVKNAELRKKYRPDNYYSGLGAF